MKMEKKNLFFLRKTDTCGQGVKETATSAFTGRAMVPCLPPLRVTLHQKFAHVRFMRFLSLIQTVQPSRLLENPESRSICRRDRENPDFTSASRNKKLRKIRSSNFNSAGILWRSG